MGLRGKTSIYREAVERLLPIFNDSEIARRVGCSKEWVRKFREKSGIPNPAPHAICSALFTEEKIGRIMDRIKKGEWAARIAREEHISPSALKAAMEKLGVVIPKTGYRKKFIPWKEIVQSWKKGWTGKECAKRWGVSEMTASRVRRDAELGGKMKK